MGCVITILYLWLTLFLQYGAPMEFRYSERLLGSEVRSITEFPYIVSIQNYEGPFDILQHSCVGVIISEYWVLTAANCVKKKPGKVKVLNVGSAGLSTGSYFRVNKIIVHPDFKPTETAYPANNIAVLHVKKSLFSHNKRAVALGKIPDESGIQVQNVGYSSTGDLGIFNIHEVFAVRLRKLSLQTVDSKHCRKKHNNSVDNEICVVEGLGETWCTINAGNPLITVNKKRLVGIGISLTHSCNNEDLPGLFVRLSDYIDWLKKVTGLKLPLD